MTRKPAFISRLVACAAACASACAAAVVVSALCPWLTAAAATPPPAGPAVAVEWQHHNVKFNYFGITVLYSCDGLENKVRQILLYLGARKDATVTAVGCMRGPDVPSRNAWIEADYWAPAPAAATNGGPVARWTPIELKPRHPRFMERGDCELVQGMKDLLTRDFGLRAVSYDTSCVPHELSEDGYSVKGEALRSSAG